MRLSEIIKTKGATLTDLAKRMPNQQGGTGITKQAMSQIVSGSPRLSTLRDLAAALGMSFTELAVLLDDAVVVERGGVRTVATPELLRSLADELERGAAE